MGGRQRTSLFMTSEEEARKLGIETEAEEKEKKKKRRRRGQRSRRSRCFQSQSLTIFF